MVAQYNKNNLQEGDISITYVFKKDIGYLCSLKKFYYFILLVTRYVLKKFLVNL